MHPSGMGLQIIDGPILGEQMVRLSEISVPPGDTFAGLDVNHGSLDQKVPALLSKELQSNQLGLVMSGPGMGRGLITLKPLGEARA